MGDSLLGEYDIAGIVTILFAVSVCVILVLATFDSFTISANQKGLMGTIIGFILGRYFTVRPEGKPDDE